MHHFRSYNKESKMTVDLSVAEAVPSAPVVKGEFVVVRRHFHDERCLADKNVVERYYIFQGNIISSLGKANALIEERMKDGSKHEDYKIFRLPIPED